MTYRRALVRAAVFLLFFVNHCFGVQSSTTEQADELEPFRVEISLDAASHNAYVASLRSAKSNMPLLELRVQPTFDTANDVANWEVGVYRLTGRASDRDRNLLAPIANWHGLQPFLIVAGAEQYYGRRRVIERNGIRCVLQILQEDAEESRVLPGSHVLRSVKLSVEITASSAK
jgi:hypothetical protein